MSLFIHVLQAKAKKRIFIAIEKVAYYKKQNSGLISVNLASFHLSLHPSLWLWNPESPLLILSKTPVRRQPEIYLTFPIFSL